MTVDKGPGDEEQRPLWMYSQEMDESVGIPPAMLRSLLFVPARMHAVDRDAPKRWVHHGLGGGQLPHIHVIREDADLGEKQAVAEHLDKYHGPFKGPPLDRTP